MSVRVILLLVFITFHAVSQKSIEAENLLKEGENLLKYGLYNLAIDRFIVAKSIANESDISFFWAIKYTGDAYYEQKQYKLAAQSYKKAASLAERLNNPMAQAIISEKFFNLYPFLQQYTDDDRNSFWLSSINYYLKNGAKHDIVRLYISKAGFFKDNRQVDSSFHYINLAFLEQVPEHMPEIYLLKGELFKFKGLSDSSYFYYSMSRELSEKNNNLALYSDATRALSDLMEKTGNYTRCIDLKNEYALLQDSMHNQSRNQEKVLLYTLFDLNKNKPFISRQEEIINKLKKEQTKSEIVYALLVAVTALSSLFIVFVSRFRLMKMNKNLSLVNNRLQETLKEQEAMAGIVAHDLKAPFNKIRGFLHLIDLSGKLSREQKDYIEMTEKVINHSFRLITDIIDINNFEQNKSIQKGVVNVSDIVKNMVTQYHQVAEEKNIRLFTSYEENIKAYSNGDFIARILDNLISNAIKFSPTGKSIFITTAKKGNRSFIRIKDEGPGFSNKDKQEMFKKFRKLSARPTAGEESTGLGLSIIKTLVDRLGHEIYLDSEENKGAVFTIYFNKTKTGSE